MDGGTTNDAVRRPAAEIVLSFPKRAFNLMPFRRDSAGKVWAMEALL
jgi:hypothetical protein